MRNSNRGKMNLARHALMIPFAAASFIFVVIVGLAIWSNYQGEIKVALSKEGGELVIVSCPWRGQQ